MPLADDLRGETDEALATIARAAPAQLRTVLETRRALDADSPMIGVRFSRLLEEAADSLPGEDRIAFADLAFRLPQPGKPGPKPRGATRRVMVYFPQDEFDALEAHTKETGQSLTVAIRAAVRRVVG